uniref:Uncharacterized protein n=1 Tax=Glossina pallidipes TaxID=7398 RepID=A0A1A9ZDL9_GLOPL
MNFRNLRILEIVKKEEKSITRVSSFATFYAIIYYLFYVQLTLYIRRYVLKRRDPVCLKFGAEEQASYARAFSSSLLQASHSKFRSELSHIDIIKSTVDLYSCVLYSDHNVIKS